MASAVFSGSCTSRGGGALDVLIAQNRHPRVQVSPISCDNYEQPSCGPDAATHHDRSRRVALVPSPALANIGTARFLAHGTGGSSAGPSRTGNTHCRPSPLRSFLILLYDADVGTDVLRYDGSRGLPRPSALPCSTDDSRFHPPQADHLHLALGRSARREELVQRSALAAQGGEARAVRRRGGGEGAAQALARPNEQLARDLEASVRSHGPGLHTAAEEDAIMADDKEHVAFSSAPPAPSARRRLHSSGMVRRGGGGMGLYWGRRRHCATEIESELQPNQDSQLSHSGLQLARGMGPDA